MVERRLLDRRVVDQLGGGEIGLLVLQLELVRLYDAVCGREGCIRGRRLGRRASLGSLGRWLWRP